MSNAREQLWIGVAIAVARSEGAKDAAAPARWADRALEAFDKQFKPPAPPACADCGAVGGSLASWGGDSRWHCLPRCAK